MAIYLGCFFPGRPKTVLHFKCFREESAQDPNVALLGFCGRLCYQKAGWLKIEVHFRTPPLAYRFSAFKGFPSFFKGFFFKCFFIKGLFQDPPFPTGVYFANTGSLLRVGGYNPKTNIDNV